MKPLPKDVNVYFDRYLRWCPRSRELSAFRRLTEQAAIVARLIVADPRVAEDVRQPLTTADLPRLYAKVPDLIALVGHGVAADGSLRRLKAAKRTAISRT